MKPRVVTSRGFGDAGSALPARERRAVSGQLKVSVVRPLELESGELERWRVIQRSTPSLQSPFLSPDFTLAVERARQRARVAILELDGAIVGFFPYEQTRFAVGRPIGVGVCDRQGLIHVPDLQWDPRALLSGCGLRVLEFDHLLADQAPFEPYHVVTAPTYIMDLTGGYDLYLQNRLQASAKSIKAMKSKERKLRAEFGNLTFEFRSQDHEDLRTLMRWKSAQYHRTGWPDRFAERWVIQLIEELFETHTTECAGTLSVLRAGERMVACLFSLGCASNLSCWFPTYEVKLGKYSPGLMLHLRLAQAAADGGINYVDLGKGAEWYKERLRTDEILLAEGLIEVPSVRAVVRRIERAPRRYIWSFVLSHPRLRDSARWGFKQIQRRRR